MDILIFYTFSVLLCVFFGYLATRETRKPDQH